MKSVGIVRKLDELGRVVLPIELRRAFDMNERDPVEIFTDGGDIILRKYNPGCVLTGSMENLVDYNGCRVSAKAIREMQRLLPENYG